MARIAGIDIPKNKRGVIALTYIFGIGSSRAKKVLAENLKQRAFKEKKIVDDANKLSKKLLALEIKIKSSILE